MRKWYVIYRERKQKYFQNEQGPQNRKKEKIKYRNQKERKRKIVIYKETKQKYFQLKRGLKTEKGRKKDKV